MNLRAGFFQLCHGNSRLARQKAYVCNKPYQDFPWSLMSLTFLSPAPLHKLPWASLSFLWRGIGLPIEYPQHLRWEEEVPKTMPGSVQGDDGRQHAAWSGQFLVYRDVLDSNCFKLSTFKTDFCIYKLQIRMFHKLLSPKSIMGNRKAFSKANVPKTRVAVNRSASPWRGAGVAKAPNHSLSPNSFKLRNILFIVY